MAVAVPQATSARTAALPGLDWEGVLALPDPEGREVDERGTDTDPLALGLTGVLTEGAGAEMEGSTEDKGSLGSTGMEGSTGALGSTGRLGSTGPLGSTGREGSGMGSTETEGSTGGSS